MQFLEKGSRLEDPDENRSIRDYTLGPIYEALQEGGNSVTIMKMLKANGENA